MLREGAFAAVFFNDGNHFIVDELARGLAHQLFFVVQLRIKIDVIHSGESGHTALLVRTSLAAAIAVSLNKLNQKYGTGWFRGVFGSMQAESIPIRRTIQV